MTIQPDCIECRDLGRHLVSLNSEFIQLSNRIRGRHPSKPERRKLIQLKSQAEHARDELVHHQQHTHQE